MSAHHDDPAFGALPIDRFTFDPIELLVLEILRTYCLHFADPNSTGKVAARACATRHLGSASGQQLAAGIADILTAVRAERVRHFNFGDPRCRQCRATIFPTELSLLQLVRAAGSAHPQDMHALAQDVVEGPNAEATLRAAFTLANILAAPILAAPMGTVAEISGDLKTFTGGRSTLH